MPSFKLNNQNMQIENATYGISKQGMIEYVRQLNYKLISETKEILEDVDAIQEAVDAGWNGEAKASFLKALQAAIEQVEEDLLKEEASLKSRFDELQAAYMYQEGHIAQAIDEQR